MTGAELKGMKTRRIVLAVFVAVVVTAAAAAFVLAGSGGRHAALDSIYC
jgi:ABC-type xylose transport system permease subunit